VDIVAKLQIKPGQRVAVVAATAEIPAVTTDDANPPAAADDADVVVAFVRSLSTRPGRRFASARPDRP
jgi:hypothetical protein